jgi:hypothetical protein
MRDCSKGRKGFDRVLMAVAATFLTVSATSAMAQDTPRASAAELAIDAAIPRPEPANVPPPTASDFKPDTTATLPDAAKTTETTDKTADKAVEVKPTETKPAEPISAAKAADPNIETKPVETKPAEIVTAPAADTKTGDAPKNGTCR